MLLLLIFSLPVLFSGEERGWGGEGEEGGGWVPGRIFVWLNFSYSMGFLFILERISFEGFVWLI